MNRKFELGDVVEIATRGEYGVVVKISESKRRGVRLSIVIADEVTTSFLFSYPSLEDKSMTFFPRIIEAPEENLNLAFVGRASDYVTASECFLHQLAEKKREKEERRQHHMDMRVYKRLDNLYEGDPLIYAEGQRVEFAGYAKSSGRISIRLQNFKGEWVNRVVDPYDLRRP